ncbi:MAG: hypothetical protein UW39_C0014G0018 [Parcubacteria group bacterium GW2011_GWC2_44_17]|nr:MAG: hypothetical protein UW39_C0014G0018 [Parcubacteria group bacterium GW2011_GWC2_44_17]
MRNLKFKIFIAGAFTVVVVLAAVNFAQGVACGVVTQNAVEVKCISPFVCSSNEFNTCKSRVCLTGVGGTCASDKDCEGGSTCNPTTLKCDTSPDDDTVSSSDLRDTIRRLLNVILGFLGIITVVMVIYGGFIWLTQAHAFMGRSWRHSYRNRVDGFIIHFERGGEGGVAIYYEIFYLQTYH